MATLAGSRSGIGSERRFFTAMALVVLVSTFIGFAPSYYLRGIVPLPHPMEPLVPMVHLHGLVFSAWVILFATQTGLVAAGRVDLHRRLGVVGMGLIAIMIPLGIYVGLAGVFRPLTSPPGVDPLSWAALPLLGTVVYGGLAVAALLNRRTPQTHKRLMLLAMVEMMQPSLGRVVPLLGVTGVIQLMAPLPFLVPLIVWDLRTRGTLHPATLWGSVVVAIGIVGTPLVWATPWWMGFVRWASSFVG